MSWLYRSTILILLLAAFLMPIPTQARTFSLGGQIERLDNVPWEVLHKAGMSWAKLQVFAAQPDTALGFIQQAHANGVKALLSAEGDRKNPIVHQQEYVNFVATLASQGADAIEIWNEENFNLEFAGSAADYARIESAAYKAIKAANNSTQVIIGAFMPTGVTNNEVTSESTWAAQRGHLPADCQGIHYEDYPLHSLSQRQAEISAFYGNTPVCYTEVGILSPEGFSALPSSFGWASNTNAETQAKMLHQIVNQLSSRTKLLIVWNVGFSRYDLNDPQAGYSIVRPGGNCVFCNK